MYGGTLKITIPTKNSLSRDISDSVEEGFAWPESLWGMKGL